MKKMILVGRSECGKTTLRQALKGKEIRYEKTQYINHYDVVIDTPGEYAENSSLARALALYSYESDIVALLISATEPYSLYPPCVTGVCNRPVIGIVTQIDAPDANIAQAVDWLALTGCEKIFEVSSYTGEGVWEILDYLKEEGDILPWDKKSDAEKPRNIVSTKMM
ncbi:ethanolamine utilization protein EutP [Acetobacterium malicum]|uniref:Ethanolamine utilization protein EutP n=1 Tax=Acetobacterium malicum TaxID=52692 RepID=A0ABR6Z1S0_9FIRM|nr:EutP/PduV family microcompartment system protein [Acetobacterium malicum]MBC3901321.1 ethanolamine utilization protein EutP [Acetobacterium malicum]